MLFNMRKIKDFKEKLIIIPIFVLMYILLNVFNISCILKAVLGFPCPFCGITRSVIALLKLDIPAAIYFHPMVWSLPILAMYYLYDGNLLKNKRANIALLALILLGFALVWALRLFNVIPRV